MNYYKYTFKILCNLEILFVQFTLFNNTIKSKDICEKEKPILYDGKCDIKYCTEEQFNSKTCQINNILIKTQWLNNIINIGEQYFRYIFFASYSNKDMIFETTTYIYDNSGYKELPNNKRIFYGFRKDGRGLFINKTTNFLSMNTSKYILKYESKNIVIKQSGNYNNEKEYLFSISKGDTYVEIYDFENNIIYLKHITNFTKLRSITSFQNAAVALYPNNTDYNYLFGFIGTNTSFDGEKYIIQIHRFKDINNFNISETLIKSKDIEIAPKSFLGLSCFQTDNQIIICFCITNTSYSIMALNTHLEQLSNFTFKVFGNTTYDIKNNNPFYKCIYLKEEIGIFAYFYNNSYPILLFKEFNHNNSPKINDYIIKEIILNKTHFYSNIMMNDIIKLTNNKICFCSTSEQKDKIYIILINLFDEIKYKIRYYKIEILQLYNYILHLDIGIHNYNNFFIAFGFSYVNQNIVGDIHDRAFNSLLIFSYPNSTDNALYLDNYLYNYSTFKSIDINLEKDVKIENNIFGYIFSGIQIINLTNCDNFQLIGSNSNNQININYTLKQNEILKFKFNIENYQPFICILHYIYKIIEPNLDIYDEYPEYLDGLNETYENFTKTEYPGRLTYYDIILNQHLTTECNEINCSLCLTNNSLCINSEEYFIEKTGEIEIINIEFKESKEELVQNLQNIINKIEIGKNYKMIGNDYILMIKPNNTFIPNYTYVDFLSCENVLRSHYNISSNGTIIFLQLEINNKNNKSLVNNIGYQAYDDNKKILDLSLCKDTNLKIFYLIKSNTSIDISFLSSFKDLNIDLLNINNSFFNDICVPYSDYKDDDVILEDRVKDFYQNYSLCDEGCTYNDNNIEKMTIICDCKVKPNLTIDIVNNDLIKFEDTYKSSIFEIIKCYNLVFSLNNKSNNIGFWIFSILILIHIPLLIINYYNGVKPIKVYIIKEMIEYGYLKEYKNKNIIDIKKDIKEINNKAQKKEKT